MSDLFLPVFYGTLASGVVIRLAEVLIDEYHRKREEKRLSYILDILEADDDYEEY